MSKAGESLLRGAREALDYARGAREGFVAHVPELIDVKTVRSKMGLSQAKFANQFGFSVDAVRNWVRFQGYAADAVDHVVAAVSESRN